MEPSGTEQLVREPSVTEPSGVNLSGKVAVVTDSGRGLGLAYAGAEVVRVGDGLVVFLASDAAAGVTGQCVGIGGDKVALWSHPSEISVAYADAYADADAGRNAAALLQSFAVALGRQLQSVGVPAPYAP